MNSIFMVSTYLRGMDKMFMDLLLNKTYAETLLHNIGQFILEFNRVNLKSMGNILTYMRYGMILRTRKVLCCLRIFGENITKHGILY